MAANSLQGKPELQVAHCSTPRVQDKVESEEEQVHTPEELLDILTDDSWHEEHVPTHEGMVNTLTNDSSNLEYHQRQAKIEVEQPMIPEAMGEHTSRSEAHPPQDRKRRSRRKSPDRPRASQADEVNRPDAKEVSEKRTQLWQLTIRKCELLRERKALMKEGRSLPALADEDLRKASAERNRLKRWFKTRGLSHSENTPTEPSDQQ